MKERRNLAVPAMVFPVKRRRTKVDQLDPGIPHPSDVSLGIGAVFRIPIVGYKQDVFWLQIRVGQMVVMKKLENMNFIIRGMLGLFSVNLRSLRL